MEYDSMAKKPVATKPAITKPKQPPRPKEPCMIEGCDRQATSRGLCSTCYKNAKDLVDTNKVSWKTLENMGMILPGKRAATPFLDSFEAKTGPPAEVAGPSTDDDLPVAPY